MINTNLQNFTSGDTVDFTVDSKLYNIKDYDCVAIFKGKETKRFETSNKEDEKFFFHISDEDSGITDGTYQLFLLFTKEDFKKTEKSIVFEVYKNITDSYEEYDALSYSRKMLNMLNSLVEGRLESDYESYTIGGRSITKMSPTELLKLRDYFEEKVAFEEDEQNGRNNGNKIIIRFLD